MMTKDPGSCGLDVVMRSTFHSISPWNSCSRYAHLREQYLQLNGMQGMELKEVSTESPKLDLMASFISSSSTCCLSTVILLGRTTFMSMNILEPYLMRRRLYTSIQSS